MVRTATAESAEARATATKQKSEPRRRRRGAPKLAVDKDALKKLQLVVVAYSEVRREWFPTEDAYQAELEVVERAQTVVAELEKLGIAAKALPSDRYFLTNLLVDRPSLVLNLVDTVRGRDMLQTSVPAALELTDIPYTGAGMRGLVIGNDRNLLKQVLEANDIPTPPFQLVSRRPVRLQDDLGLPLIVKLNESGGSVGIDNQAVKESLEEARARAAELIGQYRLPVIVEQFIDGPEITVAVVDDGTTVHVFQGQKAFGAKPDGKHNFTSLESYSNPQSYTYERAEGPWVKKIDELARQAFKVLHFADYAKFDVRVDEESGTPFFTDCNPNTAFGPHLGLPLTEVLALHGVRFETVLASLMSKYARRIA